MKIILLVIISALLTLNSCMMMGMEGMNHDSHSDHGKQQSQFVEAQNNDLKAVLAVPSLTMGNESEIVVNVYDRHGMVLSGAKVTLQFDAEHKMKNDHDHGSSSGEEFTADEMTKRGTYSLKHRFEDHGSVRVTARVSYAENSDPLILAVNSEVTHMKESHGGHSMTPMIIAGVALMTVMMVFMIGRNNY